MYMYVSSYVVCNFFFIFYFLNYNLRHMTSVSWIFKLVFFLTLSLSLSLSLSYSLQVNVYCYAHWGVFYILILFVRKLCFFFVFYCHWLWQFLGTHYLLWNLNGFFFLFSKQTICRWSGLYIPLKKGLKKKIFFNFPLLLLTNIYFFLPSVCLRKKKY